MTQLTSYLCGCGSLAERLFVRDGEPAGFCRACCLSQGSCLPSEEVSREEYLRLAEVAEVMST